MPRRHAIADYCIGLRTAAASLLICGTKPVFQSFIKLGYEEVSARISLKAIKKIRPAASQQLFFE